VISAYHVGNRELWNRMCADPGPALEMLPDVAALMWTTIQVVTAALAEAHSEVTRALQADQITLRHRLVTLLQAGVTDEETAQIASALRFDPYGDFIAVSSSAVATLTATVLPRCVHGSTPFRGRPFARATERRSSYLASATKCPR